MISGDSGAKTVAKPTVEPGPPRPREPQPQGEPGRVSAFKARWRRTFWSYVTAAQQAWPIKQPQWRPFGKAPKSWWPDIVCALAFVALTTGLLFQSPLTELDTTVRVFLSENRNLPLDIAARVLNNLGAGRVVAPMVLLLALWCAIRYKSIRPLVMYTIAYLPLGVIFLMKVGFGRMLSQPGAKIAVIEADPQKLELFSFIGTATAYPSGHAANTIVWFSLAVLIVGGALRPWMRVFLLVVPPAIVLFTQTYMGLHWLSDAPAGYLLGILIIRSVKRVRWDMVSLGPLNRFEPASPDVIVSCTVAVGGLLLCATKYLPAMILGVIIFVIGSIWVLQILRRRARR